MWSAGDNWYGVLGNSTNTNDYGDSGNTTTFNQVLNSNDPTGYLQNVIAIATSSGNSYALTSDGEVYGWGINRQGQLGIGGTTGGYNGLGVNKVQGISEVMQISTGYLYLEMLKADGTVWGVGLNDYGELGTNDTGTRVTATQMLNADGTRKHSNTGKINTSINRIRHTNNKRKTYKYKQLCNNDNNRR